MATGAVPTGLAAKRSALKTTRAVGMLQLWIGSIKLVASTTSNVGHPPEDARGVRTTSSCRKLEEFQPIHGIGSLTEKWHALQIR